MNKITIADASPELPRHDSASIVELKDGRLFLAWMEHSGGKELGHDQAPCNIASMISDDGGKSWKDRSVLVRNNPGDVNIHFPNFLRLKSGKILFYYQRRHELAPGKPQNSTSYLSWSEDECRTFTAPWEHSVIRKSNISADEPVQISSGRIILPVTRLDGNWCGVGPDGQQQDTCLSTVCYSDDEGVTWKMARNWLTLPMRGVMEPRVAELRDGRLMMTMRTQLGAVYKSESTDRGETWSAPQTTGLKAPESMPCLVRIPSTGDLLLVWNDSIYLPGFDHYGRRSPLTAAISKDDGVTWGNLKNLETDPDFEFTNPSCFFTSKDKVVIAYVASKMNNPNPPGDFGRSRMPLKAVIADLSWFYE